MTAHQRVMWDYDQVEPCQAAEPLSNEVTPESISKYAEAVLNPSPQFQVGSSGSDDMIALATQIFSLAPKNRGGIAEANGFDLVKSRATPFAKAEARWFLPIRAGDTITSVARVLEKYERRGNKFVTVRLEPENQRGERVAEIDHTSIFQYRDVETKKKDSPASPVETSPDDSVKASCFEGIDTSATVETVTIDSIVVGDNIPTLTIRSPKKAPQENNSPEGRFPWGSEHGVGGITIMGYVEYALNRWVPDGTFYYGGRILFKAIKNFRPGDTVVYSGVVIGKRKNVDKGIIDFEVRGINQFGELTGFSEATMVVV